MTIENHSHPSHDKSSDCYDEPCILKQPSLYTFGRVFFYIMTLVLFILCINEIYDLKMSLYEDEVAIDSLIDQVYSLTKVCQMD